MGELQTSKRRRVYGFEPDGGDRARFLHKYVNYLLPALTNTLATTEENPDREMEEIVRFEVDMALVLSTNGFAWSHALKHKLERKMNTIKLRTNLPVMYKCDSMGKLNQLSRMPPIERPLLSVTSPNSSCRSSRRKKRRMNREEEEEEEEEVGCRLRTLRRLLPGGNVMDMGELFPELQSYIVCLELQVSILGSLVDSHGA